MADAELVLQVIEVVCCNLTQLQQEVYNCFIASNATRKLLTDNKGKNGKPARVLSAITSLKKLCNHPKLIYDTMRSKKSEGEGFEVRPSCALHLQCQAAAPDAD